MEGKAIETTQWDIYFRFTAQEIASIATAPPPLPAIKLMELMHQAGYTYPQEYCLHLTPTLKRMETPARATWDTLASGTPSAWEHKAIYVEVHRLFWLGVVIFRTTGGNIGVTPDSFVVWLPETAQVYIDETRAFTDLGRDYPGVVPCLQEVWDHWATIYDGERFTTYQDTDPKIGWYLEPGSSPPGAEEIAK